MFRQAQRQVSTQVAAAQLRAGGPINCTNIFATLGSTTTTRPQTTAMANLGRVRGMLASCGTARDDVQRRLL